MNNNIEIDSQTKSIKNIVLLVYVLQAIAIFIGITFFVAIIINYVKRDDVKNSAWLNSHFNWQIKTFWWSLGWIILGLLTLSIGIGPIVLFLGGLWYIYRIVKGWLKLNDNLAVA